MEEKSGLEKLLENLTELGLFPIASVVDKGALFPSQNRFASSLRSKRRMRKER
jgi:hypothetical protein